MAGEYSMVPLGEVVSVRSGFAFKSSDWTETGTPVVKIANVKDGRLVMDGCSFIPQPIADSAAEFALQAGDILIAMTGYIGDVAIVRDSDLPAVLNQRVGRFAIRDPRRLDQHFLFYLLRDAGIRKEIESLGYGSAQPNVSPSLIHNVEVPLPPLSEQRAIAHILGALDDKIELNRRMNETLEGIARALFRSWFVDFDPVRAKMKGRDTGLPPHLADLFPDSFEDSALGDIPRGWQIMGLDEIATFLNGLALQTFPPDESGYLPVIKIAQLRAGHTDGADRASRDIPSPYVVEDGDVLFSWSGSLEVEIWTGGRAALNQHLFKVTSDRFPKWFYFLWTRHHLSAFRAIAAGKATTMGHIQRGHLSAAWVVIPPPGLVRAMSSHLAPLFGALVGMRLQCRTLGALRDSLLPKLISGEVRLKDSDRLKSGVTN